MASLTGVAPKPKHAHPFGDVRDGVSQMALKRSSQNKADIVSTKPPNNSNGNNAGQKRPPIKNKQPQISQKPVNTAEMALDQARQRAGMRPSSVSSAGFADKSPKKTNQLKRPTMRRATAFAPVPPSAREKSTSTSAEPGTLSSLLLSNTSTAKYLQPNAPKLLKHYRKIEPNDYWKNIRGWDFLAELNEKMGSNQTHRGNGSNKRKCIRGNDEEEVQNSNKGASTKQQQHTPIPTTFDSYREYCALWSPLCLDEARAQLLSDAVADIPYWKSKAEKNPVRVRLQPLKRDIDGSSDSMGVQVKEVLTPDYKDRGFIANDIVLLAKNDSCIWDASKGTLKPQQQQASVSNAPHGVVGHIEYTRRSVEGMTVQVSRKLWTGMGNTSEMVLLKIGSNITSLREFTALCRMDSIPLLDYILGVKMAGKTAAMGSLSERGLSSSTTDVFDEDSSAKEMQAKKVILSNMGGSSALGKGFAKYASCKFNVSQLSAISSSAQEYGSGGFTVSFTRWFMLYVSSASAASITVAFSLIQCLM